MKVGLVGYQGGGKSTLYELLTGTAPDISKVQQGQVDDALVPDERFERLCELFNPKKRVPAKIRLFDTPGLSRDQPEHNSKRLAIIREADALALIVGTFAGVEPADEIRRFEEDLMLADLQVVTNRIERLESDVKKPRPDKDQLAADLEGLRPIADRLEAGEGIRNAEFSEVQEQACKAFALLSRKKLLIVLNTEDSAVDEKAVEAVKAAGYEVVAGPAGLELEISQLDESEQAEFAAEMGLESSCQAAIMQAIFRLTELITFYTCAEKEVHAWLMRRGRTAVDAADTIHSDLARGFVRAEIMSCDDLLRLGSEREVKAAGLHHVEGKEYIVQDGDEILIRSGV